MEKLNIIENTGRVAAVQGPVVDVRFPEDEEAPAIYDCILTNTFDGKKVTLQTAEHLGAGLVRCVSYNETLNIQLGAPCTNTRRPTAVPIGDGCFGRIMDASGKPLDNGGPYDCPDLVPIRKPVIPVTFDLKKKRARSPSFWKRALNTSTCCIR